MPQSKAAGGERIRVRVTGKALYRKEGIIEVRQANGKIRRRGGVLTIYQPGDVLEVSPELLKTARDRLTPIDDVPPEIEAPAGPGGAGEGDDELERLRGEAESLGIEVDKRWREGRLREEIQKAIDAAASDGE